MNDEPTSIWTMDRATIEQTLRDGRSPRRVYSETDRAAVRAVLDRPDFDGLSEGERAQAFDEAWRAHRPAAPRPTDGGRPALAGIGWATLLGSVGLLLFAAFGYATAVHSDADIIGSTFIGARDTINIGLLQNQLMLFLLGLAGMLAGTATLLADAVIGVMLRGQAKQGSAG